MKKIYLVPSMSKKENVWMYCNYARMNYTQNVCKTCKNNCKHRGKETIIER